jgi:Eukaryotic aspartyl protease
VNGVRLGFRGKTSITDTGTSIFPVMTFLFLALMILPPADATILHNAIPNSFSDGQGNYAIPCSTTIDIAVIFGGTSFSISPEDYVGAPLNGGTTLCQSNIVGQQVGTVNQWLLGDVFLKNVLPLFWE